MDNKPVPVIRLHSDRGAPHYSITREQLSFLRTCGFSLPSIAEILQVSLATVKRRMEEIPFESLSDLI